MAKSNRSIFWSAACSVALLSLLPGLRYFMPAGNLTVFKMIRGLSVAWILFTFLSAAFSYSRFVRAIRILLQLLTALFLLHPVIFFSLLLFVFFRWVLFGTIAVLIFALILIWRYSAERAIPVLTVFCLLPLVSIGSFWWNFTMIGGGSFDADTAPLGVRAVFSVAELKCGGEIGEAHPYSLAYDERNDLLVASFKDDWGAIFGRSDERHHNFLAMRKVGDPAAQPSFLFFGASQQPENMVLFPEEKRGWVNVLDVGVQTFYVVAFSYADDRLSLLKMEKLPAEPNAVFYDDRQKRLLVIGIQMELMELDPNTLRVRSTRPLFPDLHPDGVKLDPYHRILKSELSMMMSLYDMENNRLFFATIGHFVHALSLDDFHDLRTASFPLTVGLSFDSVRRELAVARPIQQRIAIIDTESMQIKNEVAAGAPVRPVALISQRDWVLAGGYTSNGTMIYDRRSGKRLYRFSLGRLQRSAIATPTGDKVFVATGQGVFLIDTSELP